jgi:hypothetical protein
MLEHAQHIAATHEIKRRLKLRALGNATETLGKKSARSQRPLLQACASILASCSTVEARATFGRLSYSVTLPCPNMAAPGLPGANVPLVVILSFQSLKDLIFATPLAAVPPRPSVQLCGAVAGGRQHGMDKARFTPAAAHMRHNPWQAGSHAELTCLRRHPAPVPRRPGRELRQPSRHIRKGPA